MKPIIKQQFITDLTSGEFPQARFVLSAQGKYCAIGVLAEQAVRAGIILKTVDKSGLVFYDQQAFSLPLRVLLWARLRIRDWRKIQNLNDFSDLSFKEIAEYVSINL